MSQVLALSYRPKTLDSMVGQKKLAKFIRGHKKNGRLPQVWLLIGESGAGKTTIGRILAVSYQCKHQDMFGNPCKECYDHRSKFDIVEINCADLTGVDDLRQAFQGANFEPKPGSKARVYLLDETQGLSVNAQRLLFKYFEDCPETTIWINCTTNPEKLLLPVRTRCKPGTYTVPSLSQKGVRILVKRALRHVKSELDYDELSEALNENNVTSPRIVLGAVEKYLAGMSPEDAAKDVSTEVDTYSICRNLIKGLWLVVAENLKAAKPEDANAIRASVATYLRGILVEEGGFSRRTKNVADAIRALGSIGYLDDKMQLNVITAVLHQLCKTFSNYKM